MPAPNQAFRGASLYSGIFDAPEPSKESQQDESSSRASTSTSQPAEAGSKLSSNKGVEPAAATTSDDAAGPSKSSGWSAALRFAPRRTAAAAKAKARPNAAFVAAFAPAASTSADTAELPKGALSRAPGVAPKSSSSSEPASEPALAPAPAAADAEGSSVRTDKSSARPLAGLNTSDLKLTALALPHADSDDGWLMSQLEKYPVTEPPPFTLPPEDIERDKALIRKAAEARGETRHHHYDDQEGGDEEDADVNGFFSTSAGKRAARKKKKRKRGTSPPAGPNMNAEYDPRIPNDYMAYKQLVYERRRAELDFRQWEQEREEREYGEEQEEGWHEEEHEWQNDEEKPLLSSVSAHSADTQREDPKPAAVTHALTGEEAYARRVTMNAGPSTANNAAVPAAPPSGEEVYQRRVAMTNAATGEEAYLRRLAMSQASPPGPPPPGPPPRPPPGPPPPRPPSSSSQTDLLSARQTAAAAIAARLAALQPSDPATTPSSSSPSNPPSDPSTFASRLMTSYGYVPGTGLGASSSGILEPLTVSSSSTGRGQIINASQPSTEASKYGAAQASPIIVLLNMATRSDLENQEDLIEDVASECAQFGIVKRVFVHAAAEEMRVFVQFSGVAGSWKAVRGLDGRWFEGKSVKAFYYDEEAFGRGDFDLALSRGTS